MEINIKPNELIHSYRFEHPIGYGANGVVWKAHHLHMDLSVAIKVIDTQDLDPLNLDRVKQECRIGGKLSHQVHVVEVRDAFPDQGRFFIVMELMTGGSLENYLREHPHPDLGLTLAWALDLGAALNQVHKLGVIHRDLKPQNILLTTEAQVKLSDFGVAHLHGSWLTTAYQPGTYGYRAPEQEANQAIDGAADVFALCAVLFEVWAGKKYFHYKSASTEVVREELILLIAENYPDLAPALQQRLVETILAGLQPRPLRLSLPQLQEALQAIQHDWQQGQMETDTVKIAQAKAAQQLKPPAPATVISYLPQRPVAARSQPLGDTALTFWLNDQFGQLYPKHNLVLWFDPQREWTPLLEHLSPNLNLLRFQDSQLEIRHQVEQRPADRQTVVYLPLKPEEVDYLLPYQFTSYRFEQSPYDFLLGQGMPLPKSGPGRTALKAMLPQLIQESIGKGHTFWKEITNIEQAQSVLIRDFTARLSQFLDQPEETWTNLSQTHLADHFQAMLTNRLGYTTSITDPLGYAQGLAAHLCLADLYGQPGGPEDFPLKHLLPDITQLETCRQILDGWRHDSRYQQSFIAYAQAVEKDYPALANWAQAYRERWDDPPLPGITRVAWDNIAQQMLAWTSFQEVADYVQTNKAYLQRMARSFWATQGEAPGWTALALVGEILPAIQHILDELSQYKIPADFIRAYTEHWWQIDQAQRQAKHAMETSFPGDQILAGWLNRGYMNFLSETNQRWTALLSERASWDFSGLLPAQSSFWSKVTSSKATRRVIFLVDGLRYELGQALRQQLAGEDVTLEAMITGLPSITPLGMSALLPEAAKRQVGWQDKDWQITLPGFAGNLAHKAERDKVWRQAGFQDILSLSDWLRPETKLNQETGWLMVTAGQIDSVGENTGILTPTMVEELVHQIARGVRKAIKAGFAEIHVITDHGFLLFDQVADHGKAELPAQEWLKKSSRYAIGRTLLPTEHLHFPLPGSSDLVGWFPHGTICFKSLGQYNYVHGGPALQEVIIPHLTVRTSVLSTPVGVVIEADAEARNAVFKVSLKPVQQGLVSQEREVRLVLEGADGREIRTSTEIINLEQPVVKNFKITPGDQVTFGETLAINVYDARTKERLDRRTLRFLVSLDL